MNRLLSRLLAGLLRAVVFVAGLVLFLSLLAAALLLALLWGVRALWARLSGRPAAPWAMGVDPRGAWRAAANRAAWRRASAPPAAPTPPQSGAAGPLLRPLPGTGDVTDVQARTPRD